MAPDEHGRLWIEAVGLGLGIRENELECYDADNTLIEDYQGLLVGQAEAQARSEAEARAAEAETRLAALEAEMRRLRGEQ